MKTVTLLVTLFLPKLISSLQCTKTFANNQVKIETGNSQIHDEFVTGCINSRTISYNRYSKNTITVNDQIINVLYEGAVSDVYGDLKVDISNNRMSTVKTSAFSDLPGLHTLYLNNNGIRLIESNAFQNLPSLADIHIKNNIIEVLSKNTFENLPSLGGVWLDNNRLTHFEQDCFRNTPKLIYLVLDRNLLSSVPKAAFTTLPALESVSIVDKKLTYVDKDAFLGLNYLNELDLGNNRLKSFETNLAKVRDLYLNHNQITFLTANMFKNIQHSLRQLSIHSNPVQCACSDELIKWAHNNRIKLSWQCLNYQFYCTYPKSGATDCVQRSLNQFTNDVLTGFGTYCVEREFNEL